MYISSIRLSNYKCFYDSTQLKLEPGFNVITGQNVAGKTALLEGLSLKFSAKPHCSLRTKPMVSTPLEQESRADLSFTLEREELQKMLTDFIEGFNIPLPSQGTQFAGGEMFDLNAPGSVANFGRWVLSKDAYTFGFKYLKHGDSERWEFLRFPSYGLYEVSTARGSALCQRFKFGQENNSLTSLATPSDMKFQNEFGYQLLPRLRSSIYCFRAERVIGTHQVGISNRLEPDARNLAEVIHNLQSNTVMFNEFNKLVSDVLPQIQGISAFNVDDRKVELRVWSDRSSLKRNDLAIPLSETGTGVGQVVAILYVVYTSEHPSVIIIDEPQSFLHPGAVRNLIEVLKLYPQHQFIVSTHSPTVITASNPSTLTVLRQNGSESSFETLDLKQSRQLRSYLSEIGARLSDVFGADSILWVEGDTEEICFPLILERVAKQPLLGTSIVKVQSTGDFRGRHKELILEIYDRLANSNSLIPTAAGFLFDGEGLSPQKQYELSKRSRNPISLLPRRMYENYLLNPTAISEVANQIENFSESALIPTLVAEWIDQRTNDPKYFSPGSRNPAELYKEWLVHIDGAKLLGDLFNDLSQTRVVFDKLIHSVALTEWLIENSPSDLAEISDLLVRILSRTSAQ